MATIESKLPAAQQARRERLAAEEAANTGNTPAPGTVTTVTEGGNDGVVVSTTPAPSSAPTASEPAPNTSVSTNISISQEELNRLRADAEQVSTTRGRMETQELELAELRAALTAAQGASKGGGEGETPAATGAAPAPAQALRIEAADAALTAEEQEEYSEAKPVIEKIVRQELASTLNSLFAGLESRLAKLESGVSNVTQIGERVTRNEAATFVDKVKESITNFNDVISHAHWQDFQKAAMPGAGITYAQALANAHNSRNLTDMQHIFKTFTDKYIAVAGATTNSGTAPNYAGITPTSGGGNTGVVVGEKKEILKMSDRRKASEDFLKGRINQQQLDEVKKAFAKADAEGRVDYDN